MNRVHIIQQIIDKKSAKNYLEIGVFKGDCFLPIRVKRKFGVDPSFKIDWDIRKDTLVKKINRKIFNRFENYYQMTSDAFFAKNTLLFDVIFIDGLHTYNQSLIDVSNALIHLQKDGIIILHDCNPQSETEAYPATSLNEILALQLPNFTGAWSGDVWKTILTLRITKEDLDIIVLDCDTGLGIVRKGGNIPYKFNDNIQNIINLPYTYLETNRNEILHLKPLSFIDEFLKTV